MRKIAYIVAVLGCVVSFQASAGTIINFDNLPGNVAVTNQYPEVTFASTAGFEMRTYAAAAVFGSSVPNLICSAAVGGDINCTQNLTVNFTSPVNNLKFFALGADNNGPSAAVDVFGSSGFLGTVIFSGTGVTTTPQLINLASFQNVTQVVVRDVIDVRGLGYDDFSFDIPEPATFFLLAFGIGVITCARHRRRSQTSI